jgi:hypothetical protein
MQPDEYRAAIKDLDFTQEGFADLLGAKPRTGQYWASVSVPPAVATIVRLLQTRPELRTVLEELKAARIDKGRKRK